jgi:D-amino-acid dehydrogenase
LRVFRDSRRQAEAKIAAARLSTHGLESRALSSDEAVDIEPALAPIRKELVGAIRYPIDETGNAYAFCVGLAEQARRKGVRFVFDAEVESIELRGGAVTGVIAANERRSADQYVIAAGSYSAPMLRAVGIALPVRPVKGYSITFERESNPSSLATPVVDDDLHAALVPLQGGLRVAGTAEFTGYDLTMRPERIRNLTDLAQRILPRDPFDAAKAKPWCGLRPVSSDGVPIIGPTRLSNLFINAGHGHLGWTMAAGSGSVLAQIIAGETPAIETDCYSLARFDRVKTSKPSLARTA